MTKLAKNIIYNLLGQFLILALGFVAVKYIFKQLGEDALGVIYFTTMLNGIICVILEMGICSTTVREISSYLKLEPRYISDLIRTFSLFYWSMFVIFGLIIYLLAPIIVEKWINLKTMDTATAIHVLRVLGISSLLALPKSLYSSLFQGLERMEFNNIIGVSTSGLQQLGTILILAFKGSLFQVAYWFAACYIFGILIYFIISKYFFSLQALLPVISFNVIKRNWKFSSRVMFISITAAIHTQIDKIILGKLLPIGTLGYYGLAYNTASKGSLFANAISQAAFPSFSAQFKANNRSGLISQYRKMQDFLCFAAIPILAGIIFALIPLFSYILNASISRSLLLPAALLCIGFYMNVTLYIPYIFSLAVGKPGISAEQHFYDLIVTLPATIILTYYLGLIGASLSLIFFYFFHYVYALPKICTKCLSIPAREWYLHIIKIFLLAVLTYGLIWTILWLADLQNILFLSLGYIFASFAFLTGAYFMIGNELKETVSKIIKIIKRSLIKGIFRA